MSSRSRRRALCALPLIGTALTYRRRRALTALPLFVTVLARHRRRRLRALPLLAAALACAAPRPETPVVRLADREDPYLIAPLDGYPLTVADASAEQINAAYSQLRRGDELAAVGAVGRRLLDEDPGLHPAAVLLAEVAYASGDDMAAIELLRPVVDELPDYTAARLVP